MDDMQGQKRLLDNIQPKSAFWLGALCSLGLMFAVGFFVLLGLYFKDDGATPSRTATTTAVNQTGTTNTAQAAGTTTIQLASVTKTDWVRGDDNADIAIVEFSDTECPYCKQFHVTMQKVMQEYDGKVKWVYRHFPLVSLHPKAPKESEALECAGDQGGQDIFWKYADKIYEITPSNNGLDSALLPKIAEDLGLNRADFEKCLSSGKFTSKVNEQLNQATTAGGRGTPYSVIVKGDQKIPVNGALPYEQVKAAIDSLL